MCYFSKLNTAFLISSYMNVSLSSERFEGPSGYNAAQSACKKICRSFEPIRFEKKLLIQSLVARSFGISL